MFIIVISTTPFSMFAHWLHFSWTLILVKNKHIQYASIYWRWSRMVFIKLWRLIPEKYFFISQLFHLSWDVSIPINFSLICLSKAIHVTTIFWIHFNYSSIIQATVFAVSYANKTKYKVQKHFKMKVGNLYLIWTLDSAKME